MMPKGRDQQHIFSMLKGGMRFVTIDRPTEKAGIQAATRTRLGYADRIMVSMVGKSMYVAVRKT
jgi:hypothetical protein